MTDVALDWMRAQGEAPWVLHLSYVKPHWPYVAPAPYHALFRGARHRARSCAAPQDGTADEHPVVRAYRDARRMRELRARGRGAPRAAGVHGARRAGRPPHRPRARRARGVGPDARHADRVHRRPRRIPGRPRPGRKGTLLRRDRARAAHRRRSRSRAPTRRAVAPSARFVEAVDVVPTILDALGLAGAVAPVEGRSLLPLLRGEAPRGWRDAAFCELDYSFRRARARARPRRARMPRVHGAHARNGNTSTGRAFARSSSTSPRDPLELRDLGAASGHATHRARTCARGSSTGSRDLKRRTTVSDAEVERRTDAHRAPRRPHRHLVTRLRRRRASDVRERRARRRARLPSRRRTPSTAATSGASAA